MSGPVGGDSLNHARATEWGRPELPEPPADKGELVCWFQGFISQAIPGRNRQGAPTITLNIDEADVWKMMLAREAVGLMLHIEMYATGPAVDADDDELVELLGLDA